MDKYYYEYRDDGDIKYCYLGTKVLVNKFDIRNGQQLSMVERNFDCEGCCFGRWYNMWFWFYKFEKYS